MLLRCDRSITVRSGDSVTPGSGGASIRSAMTFGGVRYPEGFDWAEGKAATNSTITAAATISISFDCFMTFLLQLPLRRHAALRCLLERERNFDQLGLTARKADERRGVGRRSRIESRRKWIGAPAATARGQQAQRHN